MKDLNTWIPFNSVDKKALNAHPQKLIFLSFDTGAICFYTGGWPVAVVDKVMLLSNPSADAV